MKNQQGSQVVEKARLILSLLTLSLILFTTVSISQAGSPSVEDDDPHSGRNPKLDSYLANLAAGLPWPNRGRSGCRGTGSTFKS
jgi:hypothetical protein